MLLLSLKRFAPSKLIILSNLSSVSSDHDLASWSFFYPAKRLCRFHGNIVLHRIRKCFFPDFIGILICCLTRSQSAVLQFDENGKVKTVIICYDDISKHRQLEASLERVKNELIAEVNVLRSLHSISRDLIKQNEDTKQLYNLILDAAIKLTNATKGNFQLFFASTF